MYLLYNTSIDPYFNLALEEYLLTRTDLDIIMLWRNDKSVIVGANQNTAEELDLGYVRERGIAVVRRQSGGGAVFHDLGNINYTIIHGRGEDDFSNYAKFTSPICDFLGTLGIEARLSGRNDLVIGDLKFSGNAQAARGSRIMHHGTLLYSADFRDLQRALRPRELKFEGKAVKSVRARVTNIAAHLEAPPPSEEFLQLLYDYFLDHTPDISRYALTEEDLRAAGKLKEEKYTSWEWNFGASPAYNASRALRFDFGTVEVRIRGNGGVMEDIKIYGDFFGVLDKSEMEEKLRGVRHDAAAVAQALAGTDLSLYISGMTPERFLQFF